VIGFNADATVLAAIRARNKPGQALELWKVGGTARPWSKPLAPNFSVPAWSKDRRFLAISNGQTSVSIVDTARGEVATKIPVTQPARHMLFSLDGSRLAVSHGRTVGIYDAKNGREMFQVTIANNRGGLKPIAFGGSLLVTDLEWSFAAFDAATGATQSLFPLRRSNRSAQEDRDVKSWATAASSDGVLLVVYIEGDWNVALLDARSGRQVSVFSPLYTTRQYPAIAAMAISPAKDFVVLGTDTGDLRTWSLVGKDSTILQRSP
jgi:WD40 repeat protein